MKKLISLLLILALVLSLGACAKQEPAVNPEPDKPGKTDVKTPADYSDRKDKTGEDGELWTNSTGGTGESGEGWMTDDWALDAMPDPEPEGAIEFDMKTSAA
ncbi:MAG: hypothetical protein II021_00085, partial [Oscillospiraceae bacterium]|nr:hypothetical protein [Oscillospiraceae bacterium]